MKHLVIFVSLIVFVALLESLHFAPAAPLPACAPQAPAFQVPAVRPRKVTA